MGFFKKPRANKDATSSLSKSKQKPPGIEKRKFNNAPKGKGFMNKKLRKNQIDEDEEIYSSSSGTEESDLENEFGVAKDLGSDKDDDEEEFDPNSKTTRAAKELLKSIEQIGSDEDEVDDELAQITEEAKPKPVVHRKIANSINFGKVEQVVAYRPHRFSPVCVCLSSDNKFIVSCSKDGSVVKYDIPNKKKCQSLKPLNKKIAKKNEPGGESHCHKGQVSCCAISPGDKYLATAGFDKCIKIWNFETFAHVKDFAAAHRQPITSMVFRKSEYSLELFSASLDRSLKAWNLDQMGFVDTMYGHQDAIQQIDMLTKGRVLSCGGSDRTLRLFKVAEESQLVFNGMAENISIDTISMINEDHFVSGAADGSINVWSLFKKKPVCILRLAHGLNNLNGYGLRDESGPNPEIHSPHWISSIAACPNTDLVASGSGDGFLRLWKVGDDYKTLKQVGQFALDGFINDIRFSSDATFLACAVGQEHKNGRWWKNSKAHNSIVIVPLLLTSEEQE